MSRPKSSIHLIVKQDICIVGFCAPVHCARLFRLFNMQNGARPPAHLNLVDPSVKINDLETKPC
jgi:hypothetical protein